MFQLELYRAIRTALKNNVTLSGVDVPYFTGTFENKNNGIYISVYNERNANLKQSFGASVDLTITCFVKNSVLNNVVDIADQVEALMKPLVNDTLLLDTYRITVQQKTGRVYFQDIQEGQQTDRIDLVYNFLIDV
jgi:uncharacterized protein YqjF (DUF2071 family)